MPPTNDVDSDLDEGPWHYLSGSTLSSELTRSALLETINKTDCVTLQPCTNPALRSQDRYAVLQLDVGSEGKWGFTAVFDGEDESSPSAIDVTIISRRARRRGDRGLPRRVSTPDRTRLLKICLE